MLFDNVQNFLNTSPYSIIIAVIAVLLSFIYYITRNRGLPPGPTGVPILGAYPFLKVNKLHLQLDEYVKKYGDLFSFRVAGQLFINLGSVKLIREAHITKSEYFSGRSTDFSLMTIVFNGGVTFINNEPWKVLRKFFLQVFKDIGMKSMKDNMTGPVYDFINSTVNELHNLKGKPVNITDMLNDKFINVVRFTFFGEDGITNDQLQKFVEKYVSALEGMDGTNFLLMGKIAKYFILPFKSSYHTVLASQKYMDDILSEVIDHYENTLDEQHTRNLIDAYLKERNERKRTGDHTAEYFTKRALIGSLVQFIGDGHQAVVLLIRMSFLALMLHPDEQDKIYEELMDVVGPDRQPSIEDKSNLPYTNAFIFEVLRTSDLFPFFPSLLCTREVNIKGYRIPKGAVTLVNFWTAHHDAEVYKDPYKFDPSRFITKPGKTREELPVTFGVGKRSCMGETYTITQLFLFLTTVIKNFRLNLPEGEEYSTAGIVMKLKICANPR